jgi:hypothetical protein
LARLSREATDLLALLKTALEAISGAFSSINFIIMAENAGLLGVMGYWGDEGY